MSIRINSADPETNRRPISDHTNHPYLCNDYSDKQLLLHSPNLSSQMGLRAILQAPAMYPLFVPWSIGNSTRIDLIARVYRHYVGFGSGSYKHSIR